MKYYNKKNSFIDTFNEMNQSINENNFLTVIFHWKNQKNSLDPKNPNSVNEKN